MHAYISHLADGGVVKASDIDQSKRDFHLTELAGKHQSCPAPL
jgi:hypothetical protein